MRPHNDIVNIYDKNTFSKRNFPNSLYGAVILGIMQRLTVSKLKNISIRTLKKKKKIRLASLKLLAH